MSPVRTGTRGGPSGALPALLLSFAILRAPGVASFSVPPLSPPVVPTPSLSSSALAAKAPPVEKPPVPYGEESRKLRRTVFGYDDWVAARISERNFKYLGYFFESGIYRNIAKDVAAVALIASSIAAWNLLLVDGYTDFAGVMHDPVTKDMLGGMITVPRLGLPLQSISVVGGFLALLLSFRTNQAYNRWDEARKCWGLTINQTRNIVRNAATWSSPEYEPDEAKRQAAVSKVAGAVWSFPRSLKRHLYSPDDDEDLFQEEVRARLDPEQAEALIAATHRPNRALFDIACAVNDLPMHFIRRDEIDKSITVLIDQLGGCERLFSSPIPLFYTRHAARFLTTWLLILPFGLYEPYAYSWNHIAMIPVSAITALFLLSLEELAVQMEEPFTILPLQVYSERIGNSIGEIARWHTDETAGLGYGTRNMAGVVDANMENARGRRRLKKILGGTADSLD